MGLTRERAQCDADFRLGVRVDEVFVLAFPPLLVLHELTAELLVRVTLERQRLVEAEDFEEVREVVLVLRRHLLVGEEFRSQVVFRVGLDQLLERLLLPFDEARAVLVCRTKPNLAVRLVCLDAAILVDLGLEGGGLERVLGCPRFFAVAAVGKGLEVRLELDERRAV